MSELTSQKPYPVVVQQPNSTQSLPIVPVEKSLSPQEIERICKAFIKLISAQERKVSHDNQGQATTTHPTTNL